MSAIDDERVRKILGPQSDEGRDKRRAAEKASAQKMTAVREQRKTSSFARLLLLALLATLLFAAVRYLLGAGGF
jgi:hypothetical protein